MEDEIESTHGFGIVHHQIRAPRVPELILQVHWFVLYVFGAHVKSGFILALCVGQKAAPQLVAASRLVNDFRLHGDLGLHINPDALRVLEAFAKARLRGSIL